MSLSAASFGLPTYSEFPVHYLIVSGLILIFIFRKQILSLIKAVCGLCILIVFASICFKVMGFINYLIPLGAWWFAVIGIGILLLAVLPLLIEVLRVTMIALQFFYELPIMIYFALRGIERKKPEEYIVQPKPDPKDPYFILGVSKNASQAEIKKAYFDKIKINHPDKVACLDPEFQVFATERTKVIQSAYEALRA